MEKPPPGSGEKVESVSGFVGGGDRDGCGFCGILLLVLASSFLPSTRRSTGRLISSMCLLMCFVSFSHVRKALPQKLQGSS